MPILLGPLCSPQTNRSCKSTARGFEPLRAEPNGFLVHHLSHSVTLSHPIGQRSRWQQLEQSRQVCPVTSDLD